jgi:phenylpropionate dioxygenase-like ring-hydroxylating dioxygenase large terminal subunit
VNPDLAAAPLDHDLAPFLDAAEADAGIDLGTVELRTSLDHRIAANWKAVVENFIECYHCPLVHSTTLPGYGDDGYVLEDHGPLQLQRLARDRFAFAYLFPLTQISAYGNDGAVVARSLSPAGAGMTDVRLDYWFVPGVGDTAAGRFVDWFELVLSEDVPLCESVQTGLGTGLVEAGLLDPVRERGPVAFQRMLREALADG